MKLIFCIALCFFSIQGKSVSKSKVTDLFEGDIVLSGDTKKIVEGVNTFDAVASQARKWPNAVVPFVFDARFDSFRRKLVQEAIDEFAKHTCIRFIPRTTETNYVRFIVGEGCYSSIGMQGSSQDISIASYCLIKGTMLHEMMHALGFWHEQSRLDRDNYIEIYHGNIWRNQLHNFKKYSHGEADYYGEPYDLDSIMHYGNFAFSWNGKPTIIVKSDRTRLVGQRDGFSPIDIRQINKLYKCSGAAYAVKSEGMERKAK